MTNKPAKTRRPDRSARMETKVEPRLYAAVDRFAMEHGYTLSGALYKILLDWDRNQHRKARRKKMDI